MPFGLKLDPRRRRRLAGALLLWLATTALLVTIQSRLRLNTSHSSPPGLYAISPEPLAHDTWVIACLDEATTRYGLERAYLPPGDCPGGGRPVLKRVAALPGDRVVVTEDEVATRDLRLQRFTTDRLGRPVRRLSAGTYTVAPGTVWLYSDYSPRSWDSRYWGPVALESVETAVPLWVFP